MEIINGWEIIEQWMEKKPVKSKSKQGIVHKIRTKSKCPVCKQIGIRDKNNLDKSNKCWDCHLKTKHPYGEVTISYFNSIKHCAKERDIPFKVSLEYISKLYEDQKGLCAYTGRLLKFVLYRNKYRHLQTASLDRIDSTKGYIEGNLQWVYKDLQSMKMAKSHEEFLSFCAEISNHQYSKQYQG